MTLAELRDLMKDYELMLDNYKGAPTDAQRNAQINWAYRTLAAEVSMFDPKVVFNLTSGKAVYDLRSTTDFGKRMLQVYRVVIGGTLLRRTDGYPGLWTMDELERHVPDWRTAAGNTPTKAVQYSSTSLLLHPTPTSAGSDNFVAGTVLPDDLVNDTDEPELPVELHEAVALEAVLKAATPSLSDQAQLLPLQTMLQQYKPLIADLRRTNRRLATGGEGDMGHAYRDWIIL